MGARTFIGTCLFLMAACGTSTTTPDAGNDDDAGAGDYQWYETCGYPVCQAPDADAGSTTDTCPNAGASCATLGDTCGTASQANCGMTLVCSDHNPRDVGCPISSRRYKDDVEYLDEPGLERLHDETLRMRLATYHYKPQVADANAPRVGFIIEDQPQSPAVDPAHNRVDMYGYVSMVVATMQVQEKEIRALKQELERTKRVCAPARR